MKSANNGFRIVAVLIVLLFAEACVSRVTDSVQSASPTQLPVIVMTLGPQFASNVSPEPTPTAYSTYSDTLLIDLKTNYKSRLLLAIGQKLVIIPPEEWGYYGWDVTVDEQFLQLDPSIDVKHPPVTGWRWTPKRTGQTRLTISSVPDPCLKSTPPCSVPVFGVTFDITIE
jgi:hypothetical protein